MRKLGFTQLRVRHHNDLARIELILEEIPLLLGNDKLRLSIHAELKNLGFDYIALDLLGYRTGSMNEAIKEKNIRLQPERI